MDRGYGKYEYAAELGLQFPCVECRDDGTYHKRPHHTCFISDWEAEGVLKQVGLIDKEEEFYKQESIIPVIEAYGLDKEKFWYAVVYVALLTRIWSEEKGLDPLPSALEQLTKMRDEIKDRNDFKVVIDNPTESHSFMMEGRRLVRELLVGALDKLIEEERSSSMADTQEIPIWRERASFKTTETTWYAANMFKRLLTSLNLPVLRSRGKGAGTYDKNQLIAELIHFLNLTDNPDLDGNSIKAILKSKRKFGLGFI